MKNDVLRAQKCLEFLPNYPDDVKDIKERGIAIEKEIPENAILFIGINPSFDAKKQKTQSQEGYSPIYDFNDMKNNPGFYGKAISIVEDLNRDGVNFSFGHHDLFPVRETNQKKIEGMFQNKGDKLSPKDEFSIFIHESLKWSEEVVIQSKPAMIVVLNAFASKLFFDYQIEGNHSLLNFVPADDELWCPELGTDFVRIGNKPVPILFSGMLSGQRALDRGSEFRLRWHINFILKNEDKWPR